MKEQKVIVTGSRYFSDRAFVYRTLDKYLDFLFEMGKNQIVLNGGNKGVDELSRQYAKDNHIDCQTFYANWNEYGNKAGYIKDDEMVNNGSILIAFYDGSRETKNIIEVATKKGLEVHIVPIPKIEKNNRYKYYKNNNNKQRKE